MKPYQDILVGINYTDASRHALRKAGQLARISGGKITAFHVVRIAGFDEFTSFYSIDHQSMLKAAQSSLEDFANDVLGEELRAHCVIREGVPHYELVSYANDGNYDLLVLGDDDYASDSKQSGQFTIKCLRFVSMPVLLVNRPGQEGDNTIAACVDFSKSTAAIIEHATHFASINNDTIEITHACRPPWLRPERLRYQTEVFADQGQKEQYREILEGQLSGIRQSAASISTGEIKSTWIEDENPVNALVDHLSNPTTSLIILGRTGKGFKSMIADLLGGTAETIIRNTRHPILIIPILN